MADDGGGTDNHSRTETKTFKNDVLRAKKKAFLTRKECIKKKTMELSVLCDVKACAVILGPDGQIDSWPENRSDVREVINLYQNGSLNNKRKQQYDDRGCNKKQVLGGDEGAQNRALNLEEFLKKLESKLDEVKKRIQFFKSKDQEIESGCSFVKYDTSEEANKPDYSFSYQLGNPLRGGIPPNAWSPKNSQNLGSHSNVGMLGFGNQLPVDIVSSTPGYIGGFRGNVDGMDFGPVVSFEPMSQVGFQSGQYLPSSLQPQPSNAASFSTTQNLHMPYYAGHTPYSQAPQIQQLPGFSEQLKVPQPQMQHNAPSAPRQGPVMENLLQIPAQPFQPLNQALSQFAQMRSQTPQTSFQSSQQAFSQLQQQLHVEQPWNYIDCATAPSWFETESTLMTRGEQFQQNYIDNIDDSSWMRSPIFPETSSFNPTVETPCCCDFQLDEIHGLEPAGQITLSFDHCITGVELPATENDSFSAGVELTLNQVDTSSTGLDSELELPPTESTLKTRGEQSQQNYIDNSDDCSWMQSPIFQETTSFNPTVETPCCCDFQLDEIHGFEPDGQISLSFDHCITGVELPAIENDSFSAEVELTSNQVDTSSTVLDSEIELSPTEYSLPNSCCSDTIMPMGEEDDLAVLLQQFQRTAPTLDSFNPDCGLMDTFGFPSELLSLLGNQLCGWLQELSSKKPVTGASPM